MKHLFLLSFILITLSSFSQKVENKKYNNMTSGQLFLKSSDYQLYALGTVAASGLVCSLPSIFNFSNKGDNTACYVIGGLIGGMAILCEVKSIILFRKGAKKLDLEQRNASTYVSLQPSDSGLGAKIIF